MIINMKKCKMVSKDMETIAFMLDDNHYGKSKITHLTLCQNNIKGEGVKFLSPAIKVNESLVTLNLSSCKLGVSGMVSLCDALKTNSSI